MEDKSFSISLKCVFCDCAINGNTEQEFNSGDMIKCQECEELNDYDVLIELATKEGEELVAERIQSEMEKKLKKLFK